MSRRKRRLAVPSLSVFIDTALSEECGGGGAEKSGRWRAVTALSRQHHLSHLGVVAIKSHIAPFRRRCGRRYTNGGRRGAKERNTASNVDAAAANICPEGGAVAEGAGRPHNRSKSAASATIFAVR